MKSDARIDFIRIARKTLLILPVWLLLGAPSAGARDLADLFPSLFGGDGLQMDNAFVGEAAAAGNSFDQFGAPALDQASALSNAVNSGLTQLGLGGAPLSFTFDVQQAVFVRTNESLGPLLAERPETVGKGRLNLAFAFTRRNFDRLEGDDLSSVQSRLRHVNLCTAADGVFPADCPADPGVFGQPEFELDTIDLDLSINFQQSLFEFFANYGITSNWDVGMIIPLVYNDLDVRARATINNARPGNESINRFLDPASLEPPENLRADVAVSSSQLNVATDSADDDAFGIGDIVLRTKYNFLRDHSWAPRTAVLGQIKLGTGVEDDFLGTGEFDFMAMFIASRTYGVITPHLNLGIELSTGGSEFHNIQYALGFDWRVIERLTLSADFLGRNEFSGDGIADDLFDFGVGAKVNVFKSWGLFGAAAFPINRDEGLRTNVTWTIGTEYTF